MSWLKSHRLPVVAAIFLVTGLALMVAALRVDTSTTESTPTALAADTMIPTVATAAVAVGTPAASDPRATRLFARAQTANRMLKYGGVKVVSRTDQGRTSNVVVTVAHIPGQGTTVSAGDPASPDATTGISSYTVESGTTDEAAMLAALVRNYRLTSAGTATLLGRTASIVEADRADGSIAARFWVDGKTGLVLRRELVNTEGKTVETASYVRVDFDPKVTLTPSSTAASPARAWSVVDDAGVSSLRAAGWPVPASLRGGMGLYQVRQQASSTGPVVQLSYTDGLIAMSVFLQKGELDDASLTDYVPLDVSDGRVWVRNSGYFFVWQTRANPAVDSLTPTAAATSTPTPAAPSDIVVSATTDTPLAPVGSILDALPAEHPASDGVGERVTRGVHRVTSWFDPLS